MNWLDRLAVARVRQAYYNEHEREEHREARLKMERARARMNDARLQQRIYENDLRNLLRLRRSRQPSPFRDEEAELLKKIAALKAEERQAHLDWHLSQFHTDRNDFKKYYKHLNRTRPIIMVIVLALWFILFWFGGAGVVWRVVIAFFALATTVGSVFEMIFSLKVRDRLIRPVESLIAGVSEISKGNYNITVEEEGISEVSSLIRAFNEMAKKLGESEKLKAEYEENRKALVANISHDLKTPITVIEGYVEAITANRDLPPEKLETYLKVIQQNAAYMDRLIDDLFLFSKLDMQKLDFRFETVAVKPFIADMMQEFEIELGDKGVSFAYEDALAEDVAVRLDAKRFYQVARNLIDNAVKYGAAARPEIRTRLYACENAVCLDIADNGPGIPEENLPHIFERFYRADTQRTKDLASTGLGLAIARELTRAHGGDISAANLAVAGTCFTVSIPRLKEAH